jgi:hypothetical protein
VTLRSLIEERVVYEQRFQGQTFDYRGKIALTRFDCCEFVKCDILIDDTTEQLAFTECVFCDCNIDHLKANNDRALIARANTFERPLEERRLAFEMDLAKALSSRPGARE